MSNKLCDKYSYPIMWSDEDGEFIGLCAEFPSLSWLDPSQDEAFKGIRKLVLKVKKDMHKQNELIPEPIALKKFSGKFIVRVPSHVHRTLALSAQEAKISLNRYVAAKLTNEQHSI